jgi:hypothetical protein
VHIRYVKDYAGWRVGDVREAVDGYDVQQLIHHGIVVEVAGDGPAATKKVRHATAKHGARTADVHHDEG